MTNEEFLAQLRKSLDNAHEERKGRLAELKKKIEKGTITYQEAGEYARLGGQKAGEIILEAFQREFPEGSVPEDTATATIPPVMRENYKDVAEAARAAQQAVNDEAEIGMKPLVPEFDRERAAGLAKDVSSRNIFTAEKAIIHEFENLSQSTVDESIKENASAQSRAGLEVRVTRIYDGIGVHRRKDPCAWCIERCGTEMPYSEAYSKGSFERHPGCGCELFYKPKKGSWQKQANWIHNEWDENVIDDAIVSVRKTIGIEDSLFEENKKRILIDCRMLPDNSLRKADQKLLEENIGQLAVLEKRFGAMKENVSTLSYDSWLHSIARTSRTTNSITLGKIYNNRQVFIKKSKRAIRLGQHMPIKMNDETAALYTVTHEYGHAIQNMLFELAKKNGYADSYVSFAEQCYNEIITIATNNDHFFDYLHCISDRGRKNRFEFFAECFANSQLGDPNELGAAMTEWLSQRGL